MKRYGYVRVSSREQNPKRQMEALTRLDIGERDIFTDRISGKDFCRPSYMRLLARLHQGDVIVIKSIDRLGRNYQEILEQWRYLTKKKRVNIEVIDMPLLNTSCERDGLTGEFIADLVLQILAYVAETEREFIRQRQAEGIALAKARGVRFGVERKDIPDNFTAYYELWKQGGISVRGAAKELGMSDSTFYRRCVELREREL